MAHDASLEITIQSALKNRPAGTEVATAITAVEVMVESGLLTVKKMVKNENDDEVRRSMVGLSSIRVGGQLADALSTLDLIIDEESLQLEAEDVELYGAQNEANLRLVCISSMAEDDFGLRVSDFVSLTSKVVDALLVVYGVDGAKADPAAALLLQQISSIIVTDNIEGSSNVSPYGGGY